MCDGNLEMANKIVDMSEKDMNDLYDWETFKIFARLHPVEAYNSNPDGFCRFMREDGYGLTDLEIKELINSYDEE